MAQPLLAWQVVQSMEPQHVKEGKMVIKQGDKGDYFFVCEQGSFDVVVDGKSVHKYVAVAKEQRYPCFGELALMYAKPRAASVVALEDSVLWRLGRSGFRRVQSMNTSKGDLLKVLRKVDDAPARAAASTTRRPKSAPPLPRRVAAAAWAPVCHRWTPSRRCASTSCSSCATP